MSNVSQMTFWSTVTLMASAMGGILILASTHAGEPRHSEAADERQVSALQVRVERVATTVEHNSEVLGELTDEIKDLRVDMRASSQDIIRAIEGR